jgi:hypothetical protein
LLGDQEHLTELVCASLPSLENSLFELIDLASLSPAIDKTKNSAITLAIPLMLARDPLILTLYDPLFARA